MIIIIQFKIDDLIGLYQLRNLKSLLKTHEKISLDLYNFTREFYRHLKI